jgi:hypothetical protein
MAGKHDELGTRDIEYPKSLISAPLSKFVYEIAEMDLMIVFRIKCLYALLRLCLILTRADSRNKKRRQMATFRRLGRLVHKMPVGKSQSTRGLVPRGMGGPQGLRRIAQRNLWAQDLFKGATGFKRIASSKAFLD